MAATAQTLEDNPIFSTGPPSNSHGSNGRNDTRSPGFDGFEVHRFVCAGLPPSPAAIAREERALADLRARLAKRQW
jgi:hypothetical protein